jgi:hypothetical protein
MFEPESERYILILRGNSNGKEKNIVLSFDILEFFGDFSPEFQSYTRKFGQWLDQMGFAIKRIRILNKTNGEDSAECYLGGFMRRKVIRISNVDALFLASENGIPLEAPVGFFEAESFKTGNYEEQKRLDESDLFASHIYRSSIFYREVIQ